ncbi:MAG: hypothetical protein ACPF8W_00545 [Luminiphilus sp.]
MPLTANEDFNTGGITTDVRSQESTAVRTFTVIATADDGSPETAANASTELEAVTACEIATGDAHPDYASLFCTEFQCTREPNHIGVFRVTFTYRTDEIIDPEPPPPPGGGGDDLTGVNLNYVGKFENLWRVNADPNAEPYKGDESLAEDIAGVPTDTFGEIERSTLVTKGQVQVTMRVDVDVSIGDNYLTRLQNFIGKRNKAGFLGAKEGELLYVGATSRRITTSEYEVTHTFEYDRFKHQEQIAKPGAGPFGKAIGDFQVDDQNYRYNKRAFPVWWVQPYPFKIDFNSLGINIS